MLWKKNKGSKGAVKGNDLTAFIDEASEIEGKYTFSGTVMLNGRFTGEISSNDTPHHRREGRGQRHHPGRHRAGQRRSGRQHPGRRAGGAAG